MCPKRESNPHERKAHQILSLARLPIPPSGLVKDELLYHEKVEINDRGGIIPGMLENPKVYRFYAVATLAFGLFVFLVSLIAAMSGERLHLRTGEERTLYFDRKVLPDHVFYPVLVAVDRLELEFSDPQEQLELRMDLAGKRLEAAKALYAQDKSELAFVTLGKAHQYLLRANDDVFSLGNAHDYMTYLLNMDRRFASEYEYLKTSMTDSQKARVEEMIQDLRGRGEKLQ